MDIWESNSISQAYTSHPCTVTSQYRCSSPTECGDDATNNRYTGVCDKGGCDFNPYRMNNHTFYGPGSNFAVDSTKPITVVTQFITDDNKDNGNLVEIKRFYVQNGKVIDNSPINWSGIDAINSLNEKVCNQAKTVFGDNNDHSKKGGLKAMGDGCGVDDEFVGRLRCQLLVVGLDIPSDERPIGAWCGSWYMPHVERCACGCVGSIPWCDGQVRQHKVGALGTTTSVKPGPTSAPSNTPSTSTPSSPATTGPTARPTSAPSTSAPPSGSVGAYGQCGGINYSGPTTCVSGYTCKAYSEWYSQCIPN